jgi:hypothetical protein
MIQLKRATIAAALLAVGGWHSAFAQQNSPHAVNMYNLGLTAYKQGAPESAIIFFKRACDIDPNLSDAQYNLGVLYQSQKRLKEAIPRFQEVLRVKPMDPDAHYQLGLCLIELGSMAEAKQHLSSIPPSDKHFADAQKRIGLIDSGQGGGTMPQTAAQFPSAAALSPALTSPAATPQTAAVQAAPVETPVQTAVQTPAVQPVQQQMTAPEVSPAPAHPVSTAAPQSTLASGAVRVIATGFSAPAGLAFDRFGNLYVANFLSNSIDRINPDGSRSQFAAGSTIKGPIGLVVDNSGTVYVANYVGGTIARITPAGISSIIGTGFKKPYYLTLDRDGNLFVSQQEDNSIVRITIPRPIGAKP